MQDTLKIFENEIQDLLREYLTEDDFSKSLFAINHKMLNRARVVGLGFFPGLSPLLVLGKGLAAFAPHPV